MPENLLALAVRPLDLATPLLQARHIQKLQADTAQSEFTNRQAEMGAEFRGLAPFVNHPEFGQRWTEAMDRMAQRGILDPQRHAQLRNSPSPLLLQQGLAMTSSADQYVKMQELQQSKAASDNFGRYISGIAGGGQPAQPQGPIPGGPQPAASPVAPTASMLTKPVTDPSDPTMSLGGEQIRRVNEQPPSFNDRFGALNQPTAATSQVQTTPVAAQVGQQGAPAVRTTNPATGKIDGLVQALSLRGLPKPQFDLGMEFLKREIENTKLTNEQKEYYNSYVPQELQAGRRPEDFTSWNRKNKQAGATAINTVEGADAAAQKARLALDLEGAKEAQKQALSGTRILPLLNTVERLATKTPGGWSGPVAASMARAFSGLGIPVTEGMTNAEVLQSASQFLIPIVREPGPTAVQEMNAYLRAVPGLMQSQDGRVKMVAITKSMIERAREIAKVYRDNLGKPGLLDELAKLDKPIIPDNLRGDVEKLASQPAADPLEGRRATNGSQTAIRRNGVWVDEKTGKPIE